MHKPDEELEQLEAQNLVKIVQYLENHHSDIVFKKEKGIISLKVGECPVTIDHNTKAVVAKDPDVVARIEAALQRIESAIYPVVADG